MWVEVEFFEEEQNCNPKVVEMAKAVRIALDALNLPVKVFSNGVGDGLMDISAQTFQMFVKQVSNFAQVLVAYQLSGFVPMAENVRSAGDIENLPAELEG